MVIDRVKKLARICFGLTAGQERDALLEQIVACLPAFVHAERIALALKDDSPEGFHVPMAWTRPGVRAETREAFSRDIIGRTIKQNRPVLSVEMLNALTDDLPETPDWMPARMHAPDRADWEAPPFTMRDSEVLNGIRALICIPLHHFQKGVLGAIYVDNLDRAYAFTRDDLDYVVMFGSLASLALVCGRMPAAKGHVLEGLPVSECDRLEGLIGGSLVMQKVYAMIQCAAQSDRAVLIQGETGTGKELAARAVHALSSRKEKAFLPVNCVAFPDALLQSELFGHVKGAFTSADSDRAGLFEAAGDGTVFLDEIGEASLQTQTNLLRVLETGEFARVGESYPGKINARVIAATNRNLEAEVERGNFRQDLYYRLGRFQVAMPPLRDRVEDIPLLVEHFLERAVAESGKSIPDLTAEAVQALLSHPWPGNIRELENEIYQAVMLAEEGKDLGPMYFFNNIAAEGDHGSSQQGGLNTRLEAMERWMILDALSRYRGNTSQAAVQLGVSRQTLQQKRRKYGL